jgi:eukaryotic-like serine/threonine-protein kinase
MERGTRTYMAPEQIGRQILGPATDVWGIDVVLFEAATGRLPQIAQGCRCYPQAAQALALDATLRPDPCARPTLAELASTLEGLL